jgi:hypothetical protein
MRVLAIVLLLAFLFPDLLNACSCGRLADPAEKLAFSRLVFQGRVLSKRTVLGKSEQGGYFPAEEYRFGVEKVEGPSAPEVVLLEEFNNCAQLFSPGTIYIVYAHRHSDEPSRLSSTKCGPSLELSRATRDLQFLGAPIAEFPRREPVREPILRRPRAYLIAGIAVIYRLLTVDFRGEDNSRWPLLVWLLGSVVFSAFLVRAFRKRRWLGGALIVCSLVLWTGCCVAYYGHQLLRAGYFSHHNVWKLEHQDLRGWY